MIDNEDARDLVLPNNSYAHVLDETKGNIICYVGPNKVQLAGTDKLVIFDSKTKTYNKAVQSQAVKQIHVAPEGWYAILKNPAKDQHQPRPSSNESIAIDKLEVGRKVHLPGPIQFALWPGQMAQVVQGHRLRSNQYLIVRVYDAEAAKENWSSTIIQKTSAEVIKPTDEVVVGTLDAEEPEMGDTPPEKPATPEESILDSGIDFTVGKLMIVKGTDVSFFIPPTGIEVVKDSAGAYIREAVTLERLIYCILLDESGSKRYIRGPAVVFPRPTEVFQTQEVNDKLTRRFRAIELNEISGIYVKVIAPYVEDGRKFKEGEELFITGKQQAIYYRRDEHQIVRYGDKEIHYATAIPKGEARYILNRLTGEIETRNGPAMCLPDPRTEVIVRRVLPLDLVKLMYPRNNEVVTYNTSLLNMVGDPSDFVTDNNYASSNAHDEGDVFNETYASRSLQRKGLTGMEALLNDAERGISGAAPETTSFSSSYASQGVGDPGILTKKDQYTKPRTVTLDTKYDGAVRMQVWTGYAIIVVNGVGDRKVIEGPATYNLEYDERPEKIMLSTGKPKNTDKLIEDIYLRTKNNKVSDIIVVETKDLVEVQMKLSYRLNFVAEPEKWFDVENYVKFLCDHMRSKLKGFAQTISLSDFYANSVDHIRDTVLGKKAGGLDRGTFFKENNMHVTDVEVLQVRILNEEIADDIVETQQQIVTKTIGVARKQELLALKKRIVSIEEEELGLDIIAAKDRDNVHDEKVKLKNAQNKREHESQLKNIVMKNKQESTDARLQYAYEAESTASRSALVAMKDDADVKRQDNLDFIAAQQLLRDAQQLDLDIKGLSEREGVKRAALEAKAAAIVKQLSAVQPGLIEALQAHANSGIMQTVSNAIPLSIVEGKNVGATLTSLFRGTPMGDVLNNVVEQSTPSDD